MIVIWHVISSTIDDVRNRL